MVRGSVVPDSNPRPVRDPPVDHSPAVKRIRVSLKFLAVYGVTVVNSAAVLYIILRVWWYLTE
jgi:hypothetical protein